MDVRERDIKGKKIYIAGAIAGVDNFQELFKEAEKMLISKGAKVMNPAIMPPNFEQCEYMRICYAMIDVCDDIYFLNNWKGSAGANMEMDYGLLHNKGIHFQD